MQINRQAAGLLRIEQTTSAGICIGCRQGIWQAFGLQADRVAGRHLVYRQTGLQAGTWFPGRQGCWQAQALHADKVADRHWDIMQTGNREGMRSGSQREWQTGGLQAGTVAGQQIDRSACRHIDCGLTGWQEGRLTDRQVSTVADGRQTWWQSCTQTGKQTG